MLANYLFVFIAFLVDGAIAAMFPIKFANAGMYFIPCLGFCALVLSLRKMDLKDGLIMSILFGMFYDFYYVNATFFYAILFALLCLLTQVWKKQINDSLIENVTFCLSTIFIRELIVYLIMTVSDQSELSFHNWLVDRMFLTLLINGALVVLLVFLSFLKEDYLHQKEVKIRKEERVTWLRRK